MGFVAASYSYWRYIVLVPQRSDHVAGQYKLRRSMLGSRLVLDDEKKALRKGNLGYCVGNLVSS